MLKYISLFLFLVGFSTFSLAQNTLNLNEFGKLPILHEGRVKPLDSFARIEILKFAKRDNPSGLTHLSWLATSLFDPATAVTQKIFAVDNGEIRHILGLEERQRPLYSYSELVSGLEKTSKDVAQLIAIKDRKFTKEEQDLLSLHENALAYMQILRSFSSVLPLDIHLSKSWRERAGLKENEVITYATLKKITPIIDQKLKSIIKSKGTDPARYSVSEKEIVTLSWQIKTIGVGGGNNTIFRVIPLPKKGDYASPWELINDGKGSPSAKISLQKWTSLATALQEYDTAKWNENLKEIQQGIVGGDEQKISIEIFYNQIAPFQLTIIFFALSLIFALSYFAAQNIILYRLSFLSLMAGLIIQGLGLAFRIYVMERPPVGTLYESILFVGLVAPLISLFVEKRLKNAGGLLCGSIAGVMLGLLAQSMVGEEDNMKVLGAVLNTRFWLTTHVLCITIGYGWCLLTSILAHLILMNKAIGKSHPEDQSRMIKIMTTHSLFSLLFTIIGTILGGIWADQSWGRFWGWDPKENGALLIVLWLIWFIHGKIAGQVSNLIFVGGMAFLSVIVAVAWLGVNLLGVGLHSYGFIEGVFWGLGGFGLFEFLLISVLVGLSIHRGKSRYAP